MIRVRDIRKALQRLNSQTAKQSLGIRGPRRTTVVKSGVLLFVGLVMLMANAVIRSNHLYVGDSGYEYDASAINNEIQGSSEVRNKDPPEPKKKRGVILFWTTLFGQMNLWYDYYGFQYKEYACARECEWTSDKNRVEEADVVMFSAYGVDQEGDPPVYRDPRQIWAFFSQESPVNVGRNEAALSPWNGLFNWTVTYRKDSDVKLLYGKIAPREKPIDVNFEEILSKKSRSVAALISNCMTSSKRERLIKELQDEGIAVDVYGQCGKNTCAPGKPTSECLSRLAAQYKFFLSFENSLCRDYVTEKLFEAMKLPWVPITLGGANYSDHVPPHSVIVATNKSASSLAAMIRKLDKNDTAYLEHLQWKRTHEVLPTYQWGCELCQKLKAWKTADPPKRQTYDNLYGWWVENSSCLNTPWDLSDTMRLFQNVFSSLISRSA